MKKDKNFFHGHARLLEEREKLWATQQQAADYFGVSRVTWGQCERGNATPSGDVLAGLAEMGADVLYILTGQPSRPTAPEATLPPDERVLLNNYRSCGDQAKQNLIQTSALLSAGMAAPGVSAGTKRAQTKATGGVTQTVSGLVGGSVVAGNFKVK